MLWGWARAALTGVARYEDPEFRKFLRSYHRRVLWLGKKRAIEAVSKIR